jgi:hypothetical protein
MRGRMGKKVLTNVGLVLSVIFFTYKVVIQRFLDTSAFEEAGGSVRILRYDVCNGFANQRLSLLYGAIAAIISDRNPLLPMLVGEGDVPQEARTSNYFFRDFYDVDHFISTMRNFGVFFIERSSEFSTLVRIDTTNYIEVLSISDTSNVLHISCPLFSIPPQVMRKFRFLVMLFHSSLKPSAHLQVRMLEVLL